jgi:DNA-binding MarR family transcriptional regulator
MSHSYGIHTFNGNPMKLLRTDKQFPLTLLEQYLLLAILRRGNRTFGHQVREDLLTQARIDLSVGQFFTRLISLENRHLVEYHPPLYDRPRGLMNRPGEFSVTAKGQEILAQELARLDAVRQGVELTVLRSESKPVQTLRPTGTSR